MQPPTAEEGADRSTTAPAAAVVLAAGEGTRMRSATPKVLHALAGRTLLEHAVRAPAALEPGHLVVVVGHARDQVQAHVEGLGMGLLTAVQDEQRGTGHAVSCALAALPAELTGTVLVTYGDVPLLTAETLRSLLADHIAAGRAVTVLSAQVPDPTGYGRIVRSENGDVLGIVEHADAGETARMITEINSGVYAFDAAVLRSALGRISDDNHKGELYLTDVLATARADGLAVGAHRCPDRWQVEGVNDRVQLAAVGAELNRRLLTRWMLDGVTVTDPATVWLDSDVTLATDVVLEPGVQLRAGTSVEAGATIGPETTLYGCTVGEGASVVRTHGTDAGIGARASVGPFAYLRPGTVLGEGSKIGAFVEAKNADLGAGAKVPHLSYVGDATIGEGTNIGAATVFVNYDGVAKHHTTIGRHARTGSDCMFVAPVNVGDGAYTAAGSVITQDVPPGAMAVARAKQRNIEGWVARRRAGTPAAEAAQMAQSATAEQHGEEQE